jgi:hypothetical protein
MEKCSGRPMRELVAAVAGPREHSDTRQSWLNRAARRAGISFRSAKAVWYGEIDSPKHPSIRLLQHAAEKRALELSKRFDTVARAMVTTDPDFYRADIAALVHAARTLRGVDSSGNDQD